MAEFINIAQPLLIGDWGIFFGAINPLAFVAGAVAILILALAVKWVLGRIRAETSEPEADVPATTGEHAPEGEAPSSLKAGLQKTRNEGFVSKLAILFRGQPIDNALLDQIEAVLYTSDIGVKTTEKLLGGMRERLDSEALKDSTEIWGYLREEATRMLNASHDNAGPSLPRDGSPHVVMMIGVNGTGKTTSIGKIANQYKSQGKRVLLGAGDTFRAAAVEQLEVWATRVGADVWKGRENAEPASVLFDAVHQAAEGKYDILLADTAGRLHTNTNLVRELEKVHKVMGKALPGAPHEILLVLDATTGQNAIQQARMFSEAVPVTGIVLTKLDGTAKGGVIIGIADELGVPIRLVGVGEKVTDLRPFDPAEFITALFGGADQDAVQR